MKRVLVYLLLLLPTLGWGQVEIDPRGRAAIETLSAEIQKMQQEARTCARNHSEGYCALHASQLKILTDYRATLCKQFEVPQGELECP
jgi:hypothetical protein